MSKKRKTKIIALRVPPEVKRELQKKADSRNETLSQAIRYLLILGVEHLEILNEAHDRARQTIKEKKEIEDASLPMQSV
jgi:predicted DNA-binding protein